MKLHESRLKMKLCESGLNMKLCESVLKKKSGLNMKLCESGLKSKSELKNESGVKVHMVFAHGFKTHGGTFPMVC
jgi:hypothetical protein